MHFLFEYLLKLSISLGVVYLFYFLVLRRLTFYSWNRWYLLVYTVTCFYIPFIDVAGLLGWNKMDDNNVFNKIPSINLLNAAGTAGEAETTSHAFINWLIKMAPLIIAAGAVILLVRLAVQYISFLRFKSKAILINDERVKIYSVEKNIIPFSIGNSIFVNIDLHNNDGLKEIIRHEFVHVKQKHTIDILFTEILCIINWYNPFAWLIRYAVRQNLEFIADNNVLQSGIDKKEYQYLLLKVIGVSHFSIAPQFNFSSLKKRIVMMNKIKSARIHLVRFLFVLPLIATLLLAFRNKHIVVEQPLSTPATIVKNSIDTVPAVNSLPPEVNTINIHNQHATVILKNGKVEKYNMNRAREKAAFTKKYGTLAPPPPPPVAPPPPPPPPVAPPPPTAPSTAFSPMIIIDGKEMPGGTSINYPKAEDIESVDVLKSESAVAMYGDKGKNGVVKIKLKGGKTGDKLSGKIAPESTGTANGNISSIVINSNGSSISNPVNNEVKQNKLPDNVLYIIDGKEAAKNAVALLKPETIQSIDVLKDKEAEKQFGEKGKNGVIKITTKNIPAS
jgi:hypothetical protein